MYRKIVSIFLCFLFIFTNLNSVRAVDTSTIDKAKMAKEMSEALRREFILDESSIASSSVQLQNASKIIAPAAASIAPELAAIAIVAIGSGYVYHNREEILTNAYNVYNRMKISGIIRNFDGSVTLNQDQINSINDIMKDFKDKGISSSFPISYTSSNITYVSFYFLRDGVRSSTGKNLPSISSFNVSIKYYFYINYNSEKDMIGNTYTNTDTSSLVGVSTLENGKYKYYGNCGQTGFIESDSFNYIPTINTVPNITLPTGTVTIPSSLTNSDIGNFVGIQTTGKIITDTNPDTNPDTKPDTKPDTGTEIKPNSPTKVDLSPNLDVSNDDVPKLDFKPLQVSLSDKFPFCVPFDLVKSIKSFSVNAQAPKFNIKFPSISFGIFGTLQESGFIWDFSNFSKIVFILRYFLLIAFVIELIKLTRGIIRG